MSGSHLQKVQEGLNSMRKLLKGNFGTLQDSDRKIVEDLTTGKGEKVLEAKSFTLGKNLVCVKTKRMD